jgi:hypothetical protein
VLEDPSLQRSYTLEESESGVCKTPEARSSEVHRGCQSGKDTHQQIVDFREK